MIKGLWGGLRFSFLLCSLAFCGTALAQPGAGEFEAGAGIAKNLDGESTHTATLAWLTAHPHPWEFMLGYFGQRRMQGELFVKDSFWVGVNKRFIWKGWYTSIGVALAQENNEVLSEHFQFHTGIGYRLGDISLSLRHLSNAGIAGRNRGETFFQLHYAF